MRKLSLVITALVLPYACTRERPAHADADSAARVTPAQNPHGELAQPTPAPTDSSADSLLSPDEALRRFRAGVARPSEFEGGAASRDALVKAFAAALERGDSAALRRLVISRAEYAWLVYPTSASAGAAAREPIGLAWRRVSAASDSALAELMAARGGKPLAFVSYNCPRPPVVETQNRIFAGCIVVVNERGKSTPLRLFGPVLERDGRFKILSFAAGGS